MLTTIGSEINHRETLVKERRSGAADLYWRGVVNDEIRIQKNQLISEGSLAEAAAYWFEVTQSPLACFLEGEWLEGLGFYSAAQAFYIRAVLVSNDIGAHFALAKLFLDKKIEKEFAPEQRVYFVHHHLMQAAQRGHLEACYMLGTMYESGMDFGPNPQALTSKQRAAIWYGIAGSFGHEVARQGQLRVAKELHENGEFIPAPPMLVRPPATDSIPLALFLAPGQSVGFNTVDNVASGVAFRGSNTLHRKPPT